MAHIPKAFCGCGYEMLIDRNGVKLEVIANIGSYYKIESDRWRCPNCGTIMYTGLATTPFSHNFNDDYNKQEVDDRVLMAETLNGSNRV